MAEYLEPDGTFSHATNLDHEFNQFRKLAEAFPDLPDDELAHRLATTTKQVAKMRKILEK